MGDTPTLRPAEPMVEARLEWARPALMVLIDAEEEFDWGRFSADSASVANIAAQGPAQRLFERHACRPTYLVDYPVASQDAAFRPLAEWRADGLCGIGAQLHAWVTPPHEERVSARNSFAGNLPAALEAAKLERLTETIAHNFGAPPTIYRAGRYGTGPNTVPLLLRLGYRMDCSVLPVTDFSAIGGPDYSRFRHRPFWLDHDRTLLELPLTCAFIGRLAGMAAPVSLYGALGRRLRVPGILSRLGLLDRVRLSPEGQTLDEAKALTRALLAGGDRLLALTYHSSSLLPGGSPYVRDRRDLSAFLGWLEAYLEFFFGQLGGQAVTPDQVYDAARRSVRAGTEGQGAPVPMAG